tara:strand:- start:5752 stop:5865 length:114 start_codon:yes stop_codon:yes gene_type:complete
MDSLSAGAEMSSRGCKNKTVKQIKREDKENGVVIVKT